MSTALKKILPETKELDSYLKKAGLKQTTALSLIETLAKGSGNDNQKDHEKNLKALNDFFANKNSTDAKKADKDANISAEKQELEAEKSEEIEMVQAFETATQMIKTIQDQDLEHSQAQTLLLQAEALIIVENQGVETLETMALKQMRSEIKDQSNFDRLHDINHADENQRETNVRCDAMAITYIASKTNQDPEILEQPNPAVQLALDIQEKDQDHAAAPENALSEDVETAPESQSIQELIQKGAHIVIRTENGNDVTVNSAEDVMQKLAIDAVDVEHINQLDQLKFQDQVEEVCSKKHVNVIKPDHLLIREQANHALKPLILK